MTQFFDCLASVREQGDLSDTDYDELVRRFNGYRPHDVNMTAEQADAFAKAKVEEYFRGEANRKETLAALSAAATARLADHMEKHGDVLEAALGVLDNHNNALAGVPSVTGRRDALTGYAHGRLEEMLHNFRRTAVLGARRDPMRIANIVDEAFTKNTGDAAAKDFLSAWRAVELELLERFNAAGGNVRAMIDESTGLSRYFPQTHDSRYIAKAGPQAWKEFIRPRLDVAKMFDPLTGGPLTAERLEEALDVIYRRMVTNGGVDRTPSGQPVGHGALANMRTDQRFLIFKDGDAWREYNSAFGRDGGAYAAMMEHITGLSKDVAAMEVLGPNPSATVEWMKQVVKHEAEQKTLGPPSLYKGSPGLTKVGETIVGGDKITSLWNVVNGSVGTANLATAEVMSATRNFLMTANLAQTALTALLGDPGQSALAHRFAGIPALKTLVTEVPRQLFSESAARDVTRAGVIMKDAMEHLKDDLRVASLTSMSSELTRWLPDRVFTWTGLTPLTNAERRANAVSFMFEAGDRAGQTLEAIRRDGENGRKFARWLEGFGIDDATWDIIRKGRPLDHGEAGGMLRMIDVVDSARGDERVFEAALRYSEAVHAFMEEGTPEGTARIRAGFGGGTLKAGTPQAEVLKSMRMYLNYPAGIMLSLARATVEEMAESRWRGASFAAAGLTVLTIGGALVAQMQELRKGRDPLSLLSWEFWLNAILKGGAFGFYGDQIFGEASRNSGVAKAVRGLGPVGGLAADVVEALDPRAALTESGADQPNRAARAVNLGRRYVPVQNMWWVKPAMDRLVWDRLQLLADPEAHRQWRRRERELMREKGQGVWWGQGDIAPRRMPDWGTLTR